MNADQSNLSRLLQNLIRLGTVAEVEGAKARVQLGPKLTTEWLNWITQRAGSTCTWSAPTVSEQVGRRSGARHHRAGAVLQGV